jgi:hypothetical protein
MGRIETPSSRQDLHYQQRSVEKARTSKEVICQRAPCMFDIGGSKISFDPLAKELATQGDKDVSQCSSGHGKCMSQELTERIRSKSMVNEMSGATTAEEAIFTEVVAPAPKISPIPPKNSKGVIGVKELNHVTSTTTHTPSMFDNQVEDSPIYFAL